MPHNPRLEARLDKIEADVAEVKQTVAELEAIVIPEPPAPVDPVDIPDPDGTTPRQKWIKGCQDVVDGAAANGETISMDEANLRLINLLQSMQGTDNT